MADRFQAHKLAESCVEYLISDKEVPFVKQLEVGDELNMTHFRVSSFTSCMVDYRLGPKATFG